MHECAPAVADHLASGLIVDEATGKDLARGQLRLQNIPLPSQG